MSNSQSQSGEMKALQDHYLRAFQKFEEMTKDAFMKVYQEVEDAEARSAPDSEEVQLAKRFEKIAKDLFFKATKEAGEAKKACLAAVKKEWDDKVITIDDDDDDELIREGDTKPTAAVTAKGSAGETRAKLSERSKSKATSTAKKSPLVDEKADDEVTTDDDDGSIPEGDKKPAAVVTPAAKTNVAYAEPRIATPYEADKKSHQTTPSHQGEENGSHCGETQPTTSKAHATFAAAGTAPAPPVKTPACGCCAREYSNTVIPVILSCCRTDMCLDCAEQDRARQVAMLQRNRKKVCCMWCKQAYHSTKEAPWTVNVLCSELLGINVDSLPSAKREPQIGSDRVAKKAKIQTENPTSSNSADLDEAVTRQGSRRGFQESKDDGDEESFEEMASSHTYPSGAFKMSRFDDVNRKWLTRTNNQASYYRTKAYSPQVGDSIVYIPRAHYDILQKFTIVGYEAPWKYWPTQQPWPVVRCKVVRMRYRFSHEMNYSRGGRRENESMNDVAIIVTLKITGVPYSCGNRIFPWPEPAFTTPIESRTRSFKLSTFDVIMFDTGLYDFVIPEFLYSWRLKGLENAIESNGGKLSNLSLSINFSPDEGEQGYGTEDPLYTQYEANILDFAGSEESEFHFQGSGFNALAIEIANVKSSGEADTLFASPWEVEVLGLSAPEIPRMTTGTKNAVNYALKQILNSNPKVKEWYEFMPDTRLYSDYLCTVEVPMCLQTICERLQNDYYTNKSSVISDMRLIRENCYKYNGIGNKFYALACKMNHRFKELVDAIPDDPAAADPNVIYHEATIYRGASQGGGTALAAYDPTQRS